MGYVVLEWKQQTLTRVTMEAPMKGDRRKLLSGLANEPGTEGSVSWATMEHLAVVFSLVIHS